MYQIYSYTEYEDETMWVSFGGKNKTMDSDRWIPKALKSYRGPATAERKSGASSTFSGSPGHGFASAPAWTTDRMRGTPEGVTNV
jgi:hypothetical protein